MDDKGWLSVEVLGCYARGAIDLIDANIHSSFDVGFEVVAND